MNYKYIWYLLRKTFSAWSDHEAPRLGAALAFYSIVSLAPLLVLVVALAAIVFGNCVAQEQIIGQVDGMIGREGGNAFGACFNMRNNQLPGLSRPCWQ